MGRKETGWRGEDEASRYRRERETVTRLKIR